MDPDVAFRVIVRRLRHAFHASDFGEDDGEKTGGVEQFEGAPCVALNQHAGDFVADTLGRGPLDQGGGSPDCVQGGGFDFEAEAGGETDGAEEPEVILGETLARIADGADQLAGEVFASARVVDNLARPRILEQGVDGKVAAADVFADIGLEANFGRVAPIEVTGLGAVGCDLDFGSVPADEEDAEVGSRLLRLGEQTGKDRRRRRGGDVEVVEREAKEPVADVTADKPSFVAGVSEPGGDFAAQSKKAVRALRRGGVVGQHSLIVEYCLWPNGPVQHG